MLLSSRNHERPRRASRKHRQLSTMADASQSGVGAEEPDDSTQFVWEGIYERPWEAVTTATDGTLRGARHHIHGRSLSSVQTGVRRAVLRSVILCIDASRASGATDPEMMPSRLAVMVDAASAFVKDFFEQNPISMLAVLAMHDGRAVQLTEASCNPRQHLQALASLADDNPTGDISLQNALELCREALQVTPAFTSREVVILCASLSSSDPADIFVTIGALKKEKLRTSIFTLCAEVFICRKVAADTGGEYGVPTSAAHLRELLLALVPPRPMPAERSAAPANSLVSVGFPRKREDTRPVLGFAPGGGAIPTICEAPYRCPQCESAHTELPTQCPICGLKLMSAVELTKTYHHLFPIPGFAERTREVEHIAAAPPEPKAARTTHAAVADPSQVQDLARGTPIERCFGCTAALSAGVAAPTAAAAAEAGRAPKRVSGFVCPRCNRAFCTSCDELIHSVIRTCPGCEMQTGGHVAPAWAPAAEA